MISYDPLLKTMKNKNITAYKLVQMGFSESTFYRIKRVNGKESYGSIDVINQLCNLLDCTVSEIIEHIPDDKE